MVRAVLETKLKEVLVGIRHHLLGNQPEDLPDYQLGERKTFPSLVL